MTDARAGRLARALGLGLVVATILILTDASPRLPGLHADGIQYLEEAKSMARGEPAHEPVGDWRAAQPVSGMTFHPPGFPLALALPIRLGAQPESAAAFVLCVAGGATITLAFLVGAELQGAVAGFLAAALLASTPYWFRLHTAVWSEPLYLVFLLATALAVIKRPDQSLLHGALALACTIVRHVGIAVAGGAALVALRRKGSLAHRLAGAANAALPSALFFVGWHVFGAAADAPVRAAHVQNGWEGWGAWFGALPEVVSGWLLPIASGVSNPWIGVAAAVGLAVWVARSAVWRTEGAGAFAWFAGAAAVLHVVVVTLSSWLVDPAIPLDARMLIVPIALATIAVGAAVGSRLERARPPGFVDVTIAVVCVAWVIAGSRQIVQGVSGIRGYGQYYTAALWDHSSVIEWASEEAAQGGPLPYSNEPELVYLRTGRPAFRMPRRGESEADFIRAFDKRPGPVIIINPIRPTDMSARDVPEELELRVALRAPEGTVLVPSWP